MLGVVLSVALALIPHSAQAPAEQRTAALPAKAVLVAGKSLAGVRLGDTKPSVRERLGAPTRICQACGPRPLWLYLYEEEPLGVAVKFGSNGRVSAVFTLGAPAGWRTSAGARIGDDFGRAQQIHPWTRWQSCAGYGAISTRTGDAVTSIYAFGEMVYGFALTAHSEPVCQ
jgi:hypothetical protein